MIRGLRAASACPLALVIALLSHPAARGAEYPVHRPVPGGIAVIAIGPAEGDGPEVRFGRRPVLVVERGGTRYGVVGIGLDAPLGNYLITVRTQDETASHGFYVKPHSYPFKDDLSAPGVPVGLAEPVAWRPGLDAAFPLASPVRGRLVEAFGSRYPVGREAASVPWAVLGDIDGDQVAAPGGGTVAEVLRSEDARVFVTIDHGMGLYSSIGPMRGVAAEVGQALQRGAPLGAVGVDAARPGALYWKVLLNGVAVDPALVSDQIGSYGGY